MLPKLWRLSNGSGFFFDSRGSGDARGIRINTGRLVVENDSEIAVSGSGTGVSGDLEITARSIFLNRQGRLRAATEASQGGNIRLTVADSIILRFNSEIVAEAFGFANGGNMTINVGNFILAFLQENSDVVVGAVRGRGGKIVATARGIYGFRQFRGDRTPESDFTASSSLGIDGTVDLNIQGGLRLNALPANFLSGAIPKHCHASGGTRQQSEFIVTGSGGLPARSEDTFSSDNLEVGLVPFASPSNRDFDLEVVLNNRNDSPPTNIIEAQGWIINEKGNIELVAQVPSATPQKPGLAGATCQAASSREDLGYLYGGVR